MKLEMLQQTMWNNTIKPTKYFIFILVILIGFTKISISKNDSQLIKNDSSKITIRAIDQSKQEELLSNSDYKYDRKGPAPKSWWDKFWEWVSELFDNFFNSKGGSIGITFLKYILIAGAIILIIYLLVKNNIRALFYGKSASLKVDFSELDEDIHKINFDDLIAEAISKKDYRKAIRLHFLKLLKELTDKNLIQWKIDKTNRDYLIELTNSKYSNQFKDLVLTYEYVWYGDFNLDEENFKSTVSKFKSFTV